MERYEVYTLREEYVDQSLREQIKGNLNATEPTGTNSIDDK